MNGTKKEIIKLEDLTKRLNQETITEKQFTLIMELLNLILDELRCLKEKI